MVPSGDPLARTPAGLADLPTSTGQEPDITERKRVEEELARAERTWRNIFHAIGQPAVILDPEHSIVAANQAVLAITGRSEADLLGRKCFEIFHGPGLACPPGQCPMESLLKSGALAMVEMEMEALGRTCLVSCTPVLDEHGRVDKIIHIATDITARKRAEEAQSRLTAILESTSDLVSMATPDGRLFYLNAAGRRLLGWDPAENVSGTRSRKRTPPGPPRVS